jgi:hypothetical protein
MKDTSKRAIARTIHIGFALPLLGYIYGPPAETVQYLHIFGLSTSPLLSFREFGCGKAMSSVGLFREGDMTWQPKPATQKITPSRPLDRPPRL